MPRGGPGRLPLERLVAVPSPVVRAYGVREVTANTLGDPGGCGVGRVMHTVGPGAWGTPGYLELDSPTDRDGGRV